MRPRRIVLLVLLCGLLLVGAGTVTPQPDPATTGKPFETWLAELRAEARGRGFSDDVLAKTLDGLQPLPSVLEHDRAQPEVRHF